MNLMTVHAGQFGFVMFTSMPERDISPCVALQASCVLGIGGQSLSETH